MSRPEKPIDWKKVDHLLMSGCPGTEIAPHFDMNHHTFYDRVVKQYNMTFTEYCSLKRAQGDGLLRSRQFRKALEGDNTMLIWLGKQRLNQRETQSEESVDPEVVKKFNQLMEQLSKVQEDRKQEDISNSRE